MLRRFLLLASLFVIPACNGTLNQGNGSSSANVPSFGGLQSAVPGATNGTVILSWSPALSLSGSGVIYFVYATGPGGASGTEDMSTPIASVSNATTITVGSLVEHDPYFFIVQAADSGGQEGNTVEQGATPN